MWIPLDTATRASRPYSTVEFLDALPDKPFTVIGIITPPAGFYDTEAEAVADMKIYAAENGADAMFIESRTETSGWEFSANGWGASGGSTGGTLYRAKAIVWSFSPSPLTSSSTEPMFPTAKAVPGKPGYVFSPFDTKGRYIDVRGYPPGSKAKDPWTDKIFIVP
jgi:hypothetical protein